MSDRRFRIYIAGPIILGDLATNIQRAEDAFYELLKWGLAPFCPHWSCYASGPKVTPSGSAYALAATVHPGTTHDDWVGVDLPWVAVSDAVLRLPGESAGADTEVRHANEHGVPVFDSCKEVIRWARRQ